VLAQVFGAGEIGKNFAAGPQLGSQSKLGSAPFTNGKKVIALGAW